MSTSIQHQAGFTLLELVAVILVLGVLAVFAAVRWQAIDTYTSTTQADQLARDIRHAQTLAISWGLPLRVSVNAGGTAYSVVCVNGTTVAPCVAAGNIVVDPVTSQPYTVTLPAGVTLAPVASNTDFDNFGRPVAAGVLMSANPARTFTLSGGGNTATVVVAPITGFPQVAY